MLFGLVYLAPVLDEVNGYRGFFFAKSVQNPIVPYPQFVDAL